MKAINIQNSLLIMLLHFSIIHALKAIDSYYICTVEIRYTGVLLHINFQPHVQ